MQPIQHRRGIHLAKLFAGLGRESAFTGHLLNTVERGDQGDDLFGPRGIVTNGFMELTSGMRPTGYSP